MNLKPLRRNLQISQRQLALLLGVAHSSISMNELGQRYLSTSALMKLTLLYGVMEQRLAKRSAMPEQFTFKSMEEIRQYKQGKIREKREGMLELIQLMKEHATSKINQMELALRERQLQLRVQSRRAHL